MKTYLWLFFVALMLPGRAEGQQTLSGVCVKSVAFSADGKWVAASGMVPPKGVTSKELFAAIRNGADGIVVIWDSKTEKEIFRIVKRENSIGVIAVCPKSSLLAVACTRRGRAGTTTVHPLELWNVEKEKKIATLGEGMDFTALCFSHDGEKVAYAWYKEGEKRSRVSVCKVPSGEVIKTWTLDRDDNGDVLALAFSADDASVAGSTYTGFVYEFGIESGEKTKVAKEEDWVWAIAFSEDGKWFAWGGVKTIQLYDWKKKMLVSTWQGHTEYVNALKFGHDSLSVVSGGFDEYAENKLTGMWKIWSIPKHQLQHSQKAHAFSVASLDISPDGSRIVTGSMEGTTKIWTIPQKKDRQK